jgi:hypothetical protein
MTALTPSRMRRLISSLVNLLSSSRSIPPSMLNPQNTRHYRGVLNAGYGEPLLSPSPHAELFFKVSGR